MSEDIVLPSPKIDPFRLDVEWVRHADDMWKICELISALNAEREECKLKLELLEAESAESIRNDPHYYGLSKVTVEATKQKISTFAPIRKLRKRIADIETKLSLATGLRTAFEHRKTALENLVKLQLAGYYSEPQTPAKKLVRNTDPI